MQHKWWLHFTLWWRENINYQRPLYGLLWRVWFIQKTEGFLFCFVPFYFLNTAVLFFSIGKNDWPTAFRSLVHKKKKKKKELFLLDGGNHGVHKRFNLPTLNVSQPQFTFKQNEVPLVWRTAYQPKVKVQRSWRKQEGLWTCVSIPDKSNKGATRSTPEPCGFCTGPMPKRRRPRFRCQLHVPGSGNPQGKPDLTCS